MLCYLFLSASERFFSFALKLLRPFCSFIPGEYGKCRDRKLVYCQVKSIGVNPVDAKRLYGDKMPHWLLPLVELLVDGHICGIDFSGVVAEDCPGSGFKVGDEVFGTIPPFVGSCAEYVLAPSDTIALKPKNLTHAEASVVPLVGLTTLQALDDCNMRPGSHVLVLGASGGTGHFAVQVARIKLAGCITAVCGSRNEHFVRGLGADEVICYDSEETKKAGGVIVALQDMVEKHGEVDIVFDAVSSHDPRDQKVSYESQICRCRGSTRILSCTGQYILLGGLWHDWLKAHIKRYLGVNLFGSSRMLFWVRFPLSAEYLASLARFCEKGVLQTRVAAEYSFTTTGVQDAFGDIMSRRTVGKLCINMDKTE